LARRAAVPNIPGVEYNALFDLYTITNGSLWRWDSTAGGVPWVFPVPPDPPANPCAEEWQGIRCFADNSHNVSHVYYLGLESTNLAGSLPESIGAFSNLTSLVLDTNSLSGPIPEAVGNLTTLHSLYLSSNYLTNTIPPSIGNLTQLVFLYIEDNYLSGPLPDTMQHLSSVQEVFLDGNQLTGTIPEEVFNSTLSLTKLSLANNCLNGTIPSVLFNAAKLRYINVATNRLTGRMPSMFNTQSAMVQLFVSSNSLTGPIPVDIGNFSLLQAFDISYNAISGSLPDSMQHLTSLSYLYIATNALTGTIPPTLATNSPYLSVLDCNQNLFVGNYPDNLWGMYYMQFIDIGLNAFTGTIPDTVCDSPYLYELNINVNQFHGSIPNTIGNCPEMYYINLYLNYLTGSLPDSIGDLYDLAFLFVSNNLLTGTFPGSYGALPYLTQFDVDHNHLTGTFPSVVTGWYYLEEINLNSNMFTGTLPHEISQLPYMRVLLVADNNLHGRLDTIVNSSVQTRLSYIDLNNNQFSGPLSPALFALPLNTLSLVRNCFTGTLPPTICNCSTLVTVALDGLSSSPACRSKILAFSDAYTVKHSLSGTIPACLFTLPLLTVLHLSGNGLTGSLPSTLPPPVAQPRPAAKEAPAPAPAQAADSASASSSTQINPFLIDLSLSHNRLTGTIPLNFQRKVWYNLDLAYNRIAGTLSAEFGSANASDAYLRALSDILGFDVTAKASVYQSVLSLEDNRISGRIPQVFQHKHNISVLGTNIFSCNVRASNLPEYDDGLSNYNCGSDSFNIPYYVWLVSSVLCLACGVYVVCMRSGSVVSFWQGWSNVLYCNTITRLAPTLSKVLHLSNSLSQVALYCALFALVVLAPVYIILSNYFGTVVHQYAWMVSAAYISGVTPLVVMFVLLLVLLVGVTVVHTSHISRIATDDTQAATSYEPMTVVRTFLVYGAFISINLICVGGANAAYVYLAIYQSSIYLLPSQLLLSCFKLMWNRFFSIYAIRYVAKYNTDTSVRADSVESVGTKARTMYTTYTSLQVFVALLNNIAIPCFVVAIVSPNCFYNVFVASPAVSTIVTYNSCVEIENGVCVQLSTSGSKTTPYNPPFSYNYQCSGSMITSYAPAFVILCIVRTFVTPLLQYLLFVLYCKSTPGTLLHTMLSAVTLPVLKPIVVGEKSRTDNEHGSGGDSGDISSVMREPDSDSLRNVRSTTNSTSVASTVVTSVYQPYFDANQLLLSLITYLGVLLTFGAVFPPLAVALLLTLYSVLYTTKAKLGRFLTSALDLNQTQYIHTVENECKSSGVDTIVKRSVWMLITASCWFYTLFLFDTLGDAVGFGGAYWVLIVVPLRPLVLYVASYFANSIFMHSHPVEVDAVGTSNSVSGKNADNTHASVDLEMRTTSSTLDTVNVLHNRTSSIV